jgi:hypothetical protein
VPGCGCDASRLSSKDRQRGEESQMLVHVAVSERTRGVGSCFWSSRRYGGGGVGCDDLDDAGARTR